jgi:hypothetical protein
MKTCKICKVKFTPTYSSLQSTCANPKCIIEYSKIVESKKSKRDLKAMRERVKSVSQWRRDLQQAFNAYIRARDTGKQCISCDKRLAGKYDAGHYYSVGSYPNLRFNDDNVHGQCVECNQHKHGNLIEYSLRLPLRIGADRYAILNAMRNEPLRLPLDEIKQLIIHYKTLHKQCIQKSK